MKKIIILSSLGLYLLANGDYIPLSQLSDNKKKEYNFVEKIKTTKEVGIENKKSIHYNNKKIIKLEKKENNEIIKDYKNGNILNDEMEPSKNSFSHNRNKDFSVTPKLSYMYVTTSFEGETIDKTHDILPEISFVYKNHTLKVNYSDIRVKTDYLSTLNLSDFDLNSKWTRISYLYKFYNANIGLAYNDFRTKGNYIDNFDSNKYKEKDKESFASVEVHLKNVRDQLILEYGGFYGKNDNDVKNAYEYYINLGYKIFNNDNLILNVGYKNRTIEFDDDLKIETKGPILGISSTF